MLDSMLRPIIDPPLNMMATLLKKTPVTGNLLTVMGFGYGIVACLAIAFSFPIVALIFLILNRICDGLDGAVARAKGQASDFGGYLDIVLDFFIYAGFPLAAAFGIGGEGALLIAAFVLFSIITTGVSFLAYAIIAAKRGMDDNAHQGKKSFFFSNGLMEGTETIIFLILLCILPMYFIEIGFVFGVLCLLTTLLRIKMAYTVFS